MTEPAPPGTRHLVLALSERPARTFAEAVATRWVYVRVPALGAVLGGLVMNGLDRLDPGFLLREAPAEKPTHVVMVVEPDPERAAIALSAFEAPPWLAEHATELPDNVEEQFAGGILHLVVVPGPELSTRGEATFTWNPTVTRWLRTRARDALDAAVLDAALAAKLGPAPTLTWSEPTLPLSPSTPYGGPYVRALGLDRTVPLWLGAMLLAFAGPMLSAMAAVATRAQGQQGYGELLRLRAGARALYYANLIPTLLLPIALAVSWTVALGVAGWLGSWPGGALLDPMAVGTRSTPLLLLLVVISALQYGAPSTVRLLRAAFRRMGEPGLDPRFLLFATLLTSAQALVEAAHEAFVWLPLFGPLTTWFFADDPDVPLGLAVLTQVGWAALALIWGRWTSGVLDAPLRHLRRAWTLRRGGLLASAGAAPPSSPG